jgi:TRAP-type C4-dicarboxylate transport system permease small subunit
MIKRIERWAHAAMGIIRVASGLMLVGSVMVNFANIIGRYFFAVSIQWAEEVMLFLMIGCVFLNCGLVGWAGRQIRMDAFVALLPPRPRAIVELVCELVLIATSLLLAVMAWPVVSMLAELDQRSQAANIPLVWPQAAMPVGFLLMAFLIAARLMVRGLPKSDTSGATLSDTLAGRSDQ